MLPSQAPQPHLTEVNYDPFDSRELARAVPTTEAQRELWLADQLGREASLAYNESVSLHIEGALDVAALQDALLALSDRHEALRSTLSADGTSLMIVPRGTLQARIVDLAAMPEGERAQALAAARRHDVSDPFDLVEGPLMRATLMKIAPARHELLLTAHHIVCDGWSFGVVATELSTLYARIVGKQGINSLPAADSFGDYAVAQHEAAWQTAADADTQWWVRQYDGAIPVLELPTDRPRRAFRSFDSLREDLVLDAALTDAVRKLGGKHGASLFVTLFSVFGSLLARLSGQDDIVIGVPSAGQASDGRNALVGHCVQLLPIRMAADLEQPFAELLNGARGRVLDAYEHQSCTFGQLLKKLQIHRDPGRLPLVSVLFNLDQAIRGEDLSVAGLKVDLQSNPRLFENFDLFLNASQSDGRIVLECQYNTGLFDAASVRRWLELYRTALQRLVADASQPAVAAFAPTEADLALLARFNQSALDYPRELGVHALIARQAAATPEHLAVVAGDRRLSYRQLDQRANALAHVLRERGVKAGDLVGLSCGRNEHMLVGLVGILKAGAGYVPMDPAFPAERLEYMCSHSAAAIVVSDSSVQGTLQLASAERLLIDALGKRPDAPAPGGNGSVDDVAYVIYTSGSTGKPKGVRVPHRSVTNLLASVTREPGMTAAHNVLSVTTLSFDIAVSEVILPLTVGATIVVADRAQATDGDRLRELIEAEGVDFIDATPSTWRLLLAAGWMGGRHVRAICTGEPLPPDLGRELLPRVGELWNGYGPTETTVWSSFHRVLHCDGPVPIGHPVANTQLHVVDTKLRPVPVGVVGEIFIGGEGVTLGYHGRPDLTAERFLPDPHRPGHAWYKTGDLGRWRADGVLECLGRSDHQVKVRGYRIELGEIEANLSHHGDVDRCVVITREDDPGDVRLVGYAVAKQADGPALESNALRDFLRQSLPDYMIPSFVMQLPAIPLLPNGKIDRSKLPRPVVQAAGGGAGKQAARTPLEEQVLKAFEEVLKLPELGVADDFFTLGGHSLLAAKLTARLNKELGVALPLRTIFESPTAEGMTRAIERAQTSTTPRRAALARQADQSQGPLTVMQERIRFVGEMNPGQVTYNTPSAHRLTGPFDRAAFERALAMMVERQPSLRTCIVATDQGPVQKVVPPFQPELPFEDLSAWPAATREAEAMRRMQAIVDRPMPLDQAPLFRLALYRMAPDEHVFLFMTHHVIWDGWSFDLLYQELGELYPAALEKRPSALPALPVSYVDYAHWHNRWLASEECQSQIGYWTRRHAALGEPSALPTDHPRRPGMTGVGAVEWVRVDKALTERLRQLAVQHGVTLNMLVMAVYTAMLSQAMSSPSLVVGIPVRGRLAGEVESVMGFFNNLLPMPLALDHEAGLTDWLAAIKREMLDGFANQDVPFERLVQEPAIAARAHKAGLYQSLFSFQDARERRREWGPLRHGNVLILQKGATEDLGLWLMDVPNGLEGGLNFSADLFERGTIMVFVARLLGLLQRVADNPQQSLRELLAAPGLDTVAFANWVRERATFNERTAAAEAAAMAAAARLAAPAAAAGAGDAALSTTEARLAEVWAELLGLEAADIRAGDNFLDLGGGSLLFMRAIAVMERELGLRVEPKHLLAQTLGELAAMIAGKAEPALAGAADPGASKPAAPKGKIFGPKRL
ncbi:MAG: amino acid adenylation domain-containing protein [Burkholderiales bacterium]|nr:amino acid adenylation domain-containing protein [Burkholderiales bacterium]